MAESYRNPTFGINKFQKLKNMTETETIVSDILMILFGKPGFYPSIPNLGMDISQYLYEFEDDISEEGIKSILQSQCSEFFKNSYIDEVEVAKRVYNGHTVLVFIMPVIKDDKETAVSIAITTNDENNIIYNYIENKSDSF